MTSSAAIERLLIFLIKTCSVGFLSVLKGYRVAENQSALTSQLNLRKSRKGLHYM